MDWMPSLGTPHKGCRNFHRVGGLAFRRQIADGIKGHAMCSPIFGNDHLVSIPILGHGTPCALCVVGLTFSFSFALCKAGNTIPMIISGVPVLLIWSIVVTKIVPRLISTRCRIMIFWCCQIGTRCGSRKVLKCRSNGNCMSGWVQSDFGRGMPDEHHRLRGGSECVCNRNAR